MSAARLALALLFAGGCSGSVDGTLATREVHLVSAVQGRFSGDNGVAWVLVGDSPDLCADLKAKRSRPGGNLLVVGLSRHSGDNSFAGTLAATYVAVGKGIEAPQGPFTRTGVFTWDDACRNLATDTMASSGSVVLETDLNPDGTARGHLDLSWDDGSHVSGAFQAEPCDATFPFNSCG